MWGGTPAQFFTEAGLRCRPVPGTTDQWHLRTDESYCRTRPSLITVDHVLGPAVPRPRLDLLTNNTASPFLPDLEPDEETTAAVDEARLRADTDNDLTTTLSSWVYDTMVTPAPQLADVVADVHARLIAAPMEHQPDEHPLADAGVHLFRRAPQILHRTQLTSVLLQVEHDPNLRTGDIAHLKKAMAADEHVFSLRVHLRAVSWSATPTSAHYSERSRPTCGR